MPKVTPFLWFDTQAEEAARFYVSLFPNSKVLHVWGPPEKPMGVSFVLDGQEVRGLNGGPEYKPTEAFSFFVDCESQGEVDMYWEKLSADGGTKGQCGWLKDKFGVSWQVIPTQLGKLMGQDKSGRVMQAMLQMQKIDIAALQKAYDG